jgi:hypothetical protein
VFSNANNEGFAPGGCSGGAISAAADVRHMQAHKTAIKMDKLIFDLIALSQFSYGVAIDF